MKFQCKYGWSDTPILDAKDFIAEFIGSETMLCNEELEIIKAELEASNKILQSIFNVLTNQQKLLVADELGYSQVEAPQ